MFKLPVNVTTIPNANNARANRVIMKNTNLSA